MCLASPKKILRTIDIRVTAVTSGPFRQPIRGHALTRCAAANCAVLAVSRFLAALCSCSLREKGKSQGCAPHPRRHPCAGHRRRSSRSHQRFQAGGGCQGTRKGKRALVEIFFIGSIINLRPVVPHVRVGLNGRVRVVCG